MAASSDLILLTGATGFLGYKTLVLALQAGYRVRVAVRSQSKAEKILSAPSIKAINPTSEQLSWATVPDITVAGAYDEAAAGVKYIIHIASPIPTFGADALTPEQYEEYFVVAARKATVGILDSAKKSGTVKRIVITSSVVANIPFAYFLGEGDDKIFDADSRIPIAPGPYSFEFEAYSASKAAALNDSEAWIRRENPQFDLISIIPGWIFGRDELSTEPEDFTKGSTNSVLINVLRGEKSGLPYGGNVVHVDDVAKIHVLALDSKVAGNQAFLATSGGVDGVVWEDGFKIIKKHFHKAIADGKLSAEGEQQTVLVRIDASKTEKTFGFKFLGFEEQIKSVVSQYLEVL